MFSLPVAVTFHLSNSICVETWGQKIREAALPVLAAISNYRLSP